MLSAPLLLIVVLLPCAAALKAAVIGGGLGGLTCCNALRKVGIDAQVYERAQALSPQAGTGLTLWPNGLSALHAIDAAVLPLIKEVGGATTSIEVTSPDGLTKLPNPTGDPTRFPSVYGQPMFNIRWSKLQKVLAARLPDECIHLDCSLAAVEPSAAGGVTATFERAAAGSAPLRAEFDLVVGADGINSALRQQLVGDGAPRDAGRTIWRSIIPFDEALLPHEGCTMSAGEGKVGFLTHIGEGELYWSAFATDDAVQKGVPRQEYDDLKAYLLAQFADVHKLTPCIERTPASAILERRVADRRPLVDEAGAVAIPWDGSLAATLLGDAFHAMIPSLGQGANSSFEGAYRLAAALKGATTRDEVLAALRAYETAQMERVHWIVERSAAQGKTVYEDREEFMRKQQEAQDTMWGVQFAPL